MDATKWDKVRQDKKARELLKELRMSPAYMDEPWDDLSRDEQGKIEKGLEKKGPGWFESQVPVVTKKGIKHKAPEHRKAAVRAKHKDTLRTAISPAPVPIKKPESEAGEIKRGAEQGKEKPKKQAFFKLAKKDDKYVRIRVKDAEPLQLSGIDFFVHMERDGWRVSEVSTGLMLTRAKTKSESKEDVIRDAEAILSEKTPEKFVQIIEAARKSLAEKQV